MTYKAAKRKRTLEYVGMYPFVLMGKLAGLLYRLKIKHNAFLFFPNGDIGGSPQVNIDLTHCIKDQQPLIIFSKKPGNNQFRERYTIDGVKVWDIHRYIDYKAFHFINFFFRGLLSTIINRQKNAVVVGGESIFFYKMLPHLAPHIRCVEICHLDTWLSYTIGFIDRIDARVFSTEKLKEKVAAQYSDNHLPANYSGRLHFIDNAIDVPSLSPVNNSELQVYFIGRGAAFKRVQLSAAIAAALHRKQLPVHVSFVGDVEKIINPLDYPFCSFYGNVKGDDAMKKIYEKADVLLMTSSSEGMPIVVMQMMAHARVVVSTAVNGIPDYIHHMENGLLISATTEEAIIEEGVRHIETLLTDPALRLRLGNRSRALAMEKFSKPAFCKQYRAILALNKQAGL
jgi:L-malate glycosyltransferase